MAHRVSTHRHTVAITHLYRPRQSDHVTLADAHRRRVERRHSRSPTRQRHHSRELVARRRTGQHDHTPGTRRLGRHKRSHRRVMVDRADQARSYRRQRVTGLRRVAHRRRPNSHLVHLSRRNRPAQLEPVHLVNLRGARRQHIHTHLSIINTPAHVEHSGTRAES